MSAKADKTGSCSFCGQTKIIQVPEEWEQGQINEAVTCECECELVNVLKQEEKN